VNVASRLEGVSGHSRIIIGEGTYRDLLHEAPALATRCRELEPVHVKGIRAP
jgi:class 3 adenylate cyclase